MPDDERTFDRLYELRPDLRHGMLVRVIRDVDPGLKVGDMLRISDVDAPMGPIDQQVLLLQMPDGGTCLAMTEWVEPADLAPEDLSRDSLEAWLDD